MQRQQPPSKNNDRARGEHGRKLWGTAKERERIRARYMIRQRVVGSAHSDHAATGGNELLRGKTSDEEDIPRVVKQIIQGDTSAFSICAMEEYFHLFQSPHISRWLDWEADDQRLTSVVLSKFGLTHLEDLKEYCSRNLASFTFIELASWLGQHAIVGALIKGGISPTVKSHYVDDEATCSDVKEWQQRATDVGATVMERFFENFPLALSTYIVKRVVEMRWLAWKLDKHTRTDNQSWICGSCETSAPKSYRLCFGPSCMHVFCEVCFWKDFLLTIDQRHLLDDVVCCQVCGSHPNTSLARAPVKEESSSERRQASFSKFQALPATSRDLRSRPKGEKAKKEVLACCWADAVMTSLGNSKDIRLEKFLSFAERRNTYHYMHGCLVAGVDVNAQNEYGQTALYLAAWNGNVRLAQLLLEYGADPTIAASGGMSTIQSICEAHGRSEILQVLERFQIQSNATSMACQANGWLHELIANRHQELRSDPWQVTATVLIPKSSDHQGAGSYLLEDAVPLDVIDQIVELWKRLPIDDSLVKAKFKKKNVCCSVRSYYCDAEGWLSSNLILSLQSANLVPQNTKNSSEFIFPHMRFLHYEHVGVDLAPHVDLSRVSNLSGHRSTHTFILYLSDCCEGGETVLLQELSGKSSNIELAKISPKCGRMLLFPHSCPHKGNAVVDVPKLLIRGEIRL